MPVMAAIPRASMGNHAGRPNWKAPAGWERLMYRSYFIQLGLSAVAMFVAMYAMIASIEHFVFNLNTLYMTLLMVAPMAIIMLLFMRDMYKDRRLNIVIVAVSAGVFVAALLGIRTQTPIGDAELMRAMIPHHSGAILMCEQAKLSRPDVIELCRNIVASQRKEIAQMQSLLAGR
jgi:hypothetical protein